MNGVFYIGATGLDTQQRALDIVANNIANLNTPSFKRSRAQFSQLVSAPAAATTGPDGAQDAAISDMQATMAGQPSFMGVQLDAAPLDFTQGALTQTSKPLDVAIDGAGFIELMGPGGQTALWRGGSMMVNSDGYLAAANGMPLQAMISVPRDATAINIGADGKVTASLDGVADPMTIGQIDVVQDVDPSTLKAGSGGIYLPTSDNDLSSTTPGSDGAGVLAQGFTEASNVDLANEMVTLLLMQRSYSANAQVVQAGDQLMAIANDLRK